MNNLCALCGKTDERMVSVDGKNICTSCMYGEAEPVLIYPIGFVRNNQQKAVRGFGLNKKDKLSRIELFESQKPFLYRLEDESKITVIYYLHKSGTVKSVFHRGLDGKKTGVFASRTPNRLSRLAIQNVKLIKIEGTTLYVEGLDAINDSPVLDIKMYWEPD